MKNLRTLFPAVARDCVGLIGAALIAVGAGMVYRPAGFIVAGFILLVGALLDARA